MRVLFLSLGCVGVALAGRRDDIGRMRTRVRAYNKADREAKRVSRINATCDANKLICSENRFGENICYCPQNAAKGACVIDKARTDAIADGAGYQSGEGFCRDKQDKCSKRDPKNAGTEDVKCPGAQCMPNFNGKRCMNRPDKCKRYRSTKLKCKPYKHYKDMQGSMSTCCKFCYRKSRNVPCLQWYGVKDATKKQGNKQVVTWNPEFKSMKKSNTKLCCLKDNEPNYITCPGVLGVSMSGRLDNAKCNAAPACFPRKATSAFGQRHLHYYMEASSKWFIFSKDEVRTYFDAYDACKELGGRLGSIKNNDETNFIKSLHTEALINFGYNYLFGIERSDLDFQGGLGDAGNMDWVWSDGSTVTYSNWASGEPNNVKSPQHGNEPVARFFPDAHAFQWLDWHMQNNSNFNYMCTIDCA